MADRRIQHTEEMVGAGHPTKTDTLNRLTLIEHDSTGKHTTINADDIISKGPEVDIRAFLPSGYVTDGSVDYSTEFQDAIDETYNNGGGIVNFSIGDWWVNSLIQKDYVQCVGQGYRTRLFHATQNIFRNFGVHPSFYTGRTYYNASNIAQGDYVITLTTASDTSNFTVGKLAVLRSTGALVSGGLTFPYHVEMIKILAIDAGAGTLTLEHPIEYAVTSPILGVAETPTAGQPDQFVQYAGVSNMFLDAGTGGGTGVRSRGAYHCHYENLWITAVSGLLGNGFCHCTFNNITLYGIRNRVVEFKTGSVNTTVIGVNAYVDPTVSTIDFRLLEFGEYTKGLTYRDINIYLGSNTTASTGVIVYGSGGGSNHTVSGVKIHGGTIAAELIGVYGQSDLDSANILIENIECDSIGITNGIKVDANSSTSNTLSGVTIRNITANVSTANFGLTIFGTNFVDDIKLENINTNGKWNIASGITADISIDGGRAYNFSQLASILDLKNIARVNASDFYSTSIATYNDFVTTTTSGSIFHTYTVPATGGWTNNDSIAFSWRLETVGAAGNKNIQIDDGTGNIITLAIAGAGVAILITGRVSVLNTTGYNVDIDVSNAGTITTTTIERRSLDLTTGPLTILFKAWVSNAADSITVRELIVNPQLVGE